MYNVFNKTICVCYDINSSSGLLFIMCGYCYYIDPAAVRTCMQANFTVHGQPPQFPRASAANGPYRVIATHLNGVELQSVQQPKDKPIRVALNRVRKCPSTPS